MIKDRYIIIFLSLLFLIVAIPRIIFPELDHGDEFADACTLNAGKNFEKFGFIKCRFLPFYEPQIDTPENPYTHYPPVPEILNGIIRIISKSDSLRIYRIISLFFSLLNLIFWYLFLKNITKNSFIAFLGSIFYFANPYFIFGVDSIREQSLADFFRSLVLFSFVKIFDIPKEKQKKFWLILWFIIFLESLITLDYIIYLSLFIIIFKYLFKKEFSFTIILLLILAPVFGFALHFFQNAWYFKGMPLAIEDFKNIAKDRIIKSKDAPLERFDFFIWWDFVIVRYFSLIFSFSYFILGIGVFICYLFYKSLSRNIKSEIRILLKLLLIFCLCGISWYVVFPAHSFAHAFVPYLVRHLVPVGSLSYALFFYITWNYIKEKSKHKYFLKILWFFLIFIVLFTSITNSDLPITKERIILSKDFLVFKNCLLNLKNNSNPKDIIGVNYYRFPFMRYYLDRNMIPIFNKSFFEEKNSFPKYFIFITRNDPVSKELYDFLTQKYKEIYSCRSIRFPSVFFELKE